MLLENLQKAWKICLYGFKLLEEHRISRYSVVASCLVGSAIQCSEGPEQAVCLGMRCHKRINQVLDKICH